MHLLTGINLPHLDENLYATHFKKFLILHRFKSQLYLKEITLPLVEDSEQDESRALSKSESKQPHKSTHKCLQSNKKHRSEKVPTKCDTQHIDTYSRMTVQPSTLDVRAQPAYLVMDTERVMDSINSLRSETQAQFDSMNDRMGKIEYRLSQIVALLQTQSNGANSRNLNTNNNITDNNENETDSIVYIPIPEDSSSLNQSESTGHRTTVDYDEGARRRYWHSRTAPHIVNLKLPSFKLPHGQFSRHFQRSLDE